MRPIDADKLCAVLKNIQEHTRADKAAMADSLSVFLDYALEVVGNQPTIAPPPNDPLTLEELREMDGEAVWNETMQKWVLVDYYWECGPRTVDAQGRWRDLDDCYYRRKPAVRPQEER